LTLKGFCVGIVGLVVVVVSRVVVVEVVLDVEVVVVELRGPSAVDAAVLDSTRRNPTATITTVIRRSFKKSPVNKV
jgi:hypothetical protein